MRWGTRSALALVMTAVLVAGAACSDDDDTGAKATAATSTTTSTSTTIATTTTPPTTAATTTRPAGSATTRPRTSRATTPATAKATTTTRATCLGNVSHSASNPFPEKAGDERDVTVELRNDHTASAVVTLRGQGHALSPGQSLSLTLPPTHQPETVTAAPASNPGDRFAYTVQLVAGAHHQLVVHTMGLGTCDNGVQRTLYLRQDGINQPL